MRPMMPNNGKPAANSSIGDSGAPVYTQMNGEYVIHGTLSASGNINGTTSPVNCFYSAPIYYAEIAGFDFELS